MARRTFTAAQKNQALELYLEHGAEHAARHTGIGAATIRSWAHRNGLAARCAENRRAQVENTRLAWAARRGRLADLAGEVAERALARAADALDAGDDQLAKAAGVVFGIAVDKAQLLTGEATARTETVTTTELDRQIAGLLERMEPAA